MPQHDSILSESMHPALTRFGYGTGRLHQENASPEDFPVSARGLWLPQIEVARASLTVAVGELAEFALAHAGDSEILRVDEAIDQLENVTFDEELGCWVPAGRHSSKRSLRVLWTIAGHELGKVLNPETQDEMTRLQICETQGCLNTRHFDFTHGVASRNHLVEVEPWCYEEQANGDMITLWHDELPSVAQSEIELRRLQKLCLPYATKEKTLFTADGISKITFCRATGCHAVRSYYTNNASTDGYGRLRRCNRNGEKNRTQGLAHREVWLALGYTFNGRPELNHLCGHRPCVNVFHLEPDTRKGNQQHGRRMQKAKAGAPSLF